jgi:ABC-type phosphate/phosphonate transport system substrate-binding protein
MRVNHVLLAIGLFVSAAPAFADLVFSSPPRESEAKGKETYQPIADFLSKITGQPVKYRYPQDWLIYQSEMQRDIYDIVFDGPHFLSWRVANLQHTPLVKLPGALEFVVVVAKDANTIKTLNNLAGRPMCAHAPPNLATLTVMHEFPNPSRQPVLIDTKGFPAALKGVISGKCVAGILQAKMYKELDTQREAKVIFKSRPMPNQAFSSSRRITPGMQRTIASALLSPEGQTATAKLRQEFKAENFIPAGKEEFAGLNDLLKDTWGFQSRTTVSRVNVPFSSQ